MSSGSVTGSLTSGYGVRIDWEDTANTDGTNTSTLVLKTYIYHGTLSISARQDRHTTTINGVTQSFSTAKISGGANPLLVNTRTDIVEHDADGNKTVDLAASFYFGYTTSSGTSIGRKNVSASAVLEQVSVADAIESVTANVDIGSAVTVSVDEHLSNWHIATFTFGSITYVSEPFEESVSYTIPSTWGSVIPASSTGTATVSVQTYADAACTDARGDAQTATFTVTANDPPVCASGWYTVYGVQDTAGITGYVQGHTQVRCSFEPSLITYQNGAGEGTTTYRVTAPDGSVYAGGNITTSGVHTVTVTVTDSRGASTTATTTINVTAYRVPAVSCTSTDCYRAIDAAGNPGEAGTFMRVLASGIITAAANGNTVSMTCGWRKNYTTGSYTTQALTSGTACVYSGLLFTNSYEVLITATDKFGNSGTYTFILPSNEVTWNAMRGGKGFAFGKYAEKADTVQSAWDIETEGDITADGTVTCNGLVMPSPLAIASGGTGAGTAAGALEALGAAAEDHTHAPEDIGAAAASHTHTAGDITGLSTDVTIVQAETKIGTFLGKDLYRAVLVRDSAITTSTSAQTLSLTGVVNGSIETLVNFYGSIHLTGSGLVGWLQLNTYHNSNVRSFARVTATGIVCYCSAANDKSRFVMEYTKV